MLDTFYQHVRHNHTAAFFGILAAALLAVGFGIYMLLGNNAALLNTLGLQTTAARLAAGREAIFWTVRAWNHSKNDESTELNPKREYGYVQSVNRDATINITVVNGAEYVSKRVALADLVVGNPNVLANIVESHKHDSMEFAFYPGAKTAYPYTVIWLNDHPFNLTLITEGVAVPDRTPPTNIVDRLFASYYWQQFTR